MPAAGARSAAHRPGPNGSECCGRPAGRAPEQLLDVPVAQRIAQIPGDRLQDERRLEVTALEVVLGPALQPLGNRTQDREVPPNRRAKLTAMPDEPSTPQICGA